MVVPTNTSIRSCFFKVFVTDLNRNFFHYEPCDNEPFPFCRNKADQCKERQALQKVENPIQKDFLSKKAENWAMLHKANSLYLGLPVLENAKQKRLFKKSHQIIRPLLYLSRSEITLICKKLLIPVYPDRSNQSIKYSRNRIRKQLLPSLKLFYNPQIEQALFQFAEFICKEQDFITILSNAIPHNFLKFVKVKNTK